MTTMNLPQIKLWMTAQREAAERGYADLSIHLPGGDTDNSLLANAMMLARYANIYFELPFLGDDGRVDTDIPEGQAIVDLAWDVVLGE